MPSLDPATLGAILDRLSPENRRFSHDFPGESSRRQPIHTVYGGAHLFEAETPRRMGELARQHLETYAPDPSTLAVALGMAGDADLHRTVYTRVLEKLAREPVEDYRIDFEDGFGTRPDAEEDAAAVHAAEELARAHELGILSPFSGIRIKTLSEEQKRRALRTLDLFVTTLVERLGRIPDTFLVTLPKVVLPEQVAALADALDALEDALSLPRDTLRLEIMVEVTQALIDRDGRCPLAAMARAGRGRCVGAHFGTYDFTASYGVTAAHQEMTHPSCDFAKHMMKAAFAGTGVFLSDGATNVMPVGPHRGTPTPEQEVDNRAVVHAAWRLQYRHVRHSLETGFYQGWDLHPGQLPVRYAAAYAFFLEGFGAAHQRLTNFVDKAGQATLVGDVFDDAATGQALLNYFLRAYAAGAITLDEVLSTGLTLQEIQGRSFVRILENRRKG